MTEPLAGKGAVVTGASTGIGLAIARELHRLGASVVISARSRERLESAVGSVGERCTAVVADVTQAEDVDRLIGGAIETHGGIDVLVANAGVYVGGDVWDSDPEALDQLLRTNVTGVVRTVRAALPHMLERRSGDIVVTSSVSGHQAIYWEPVYSASKHALQAFVHGVRRQLAGTGVRMGAIAPGVVLNELWGVSDAAEIEEKVARAEGIRSEEVADAVGYMLTRPPHVNIRDLVILPRDQPI
jgi:ribitol 2-dehydrogenase